MASQLFRKDYLTNPSFQFRFIGVIVVFSEVNTLVFYLACRYFFRHYALSGAKIGLPQNHVFFQLLENQQHFMDRIFVLTSFCIMILGFVFGLIYSHRIAGPLSRLKDILDNSSLDMSPQVRGSDLNSLLELEFRKSDAFKEPALSLNEFIKRRVKK